jgi:hypothetical protein
MRLSAEDLAKTWGAAMFFGFGWDMAGFHLHAKPVAAADDAKATRSGRARTAPAEPRSAAASAARGR